LIRRYCAIIGVRVTSFPAICGERVLGLGGLA